jgi:hypothetical protein
MESHHPVFRIELNTADKIERRRLVNKSGIEHGQSKPGSNMNTFKQLKALVQTIFAAVAASVMIAGLASTLCYSEPTPGAPPPRTDSTPSPTNSVALKPKAPETVQPMLKPQLTGAELYSMHCNRCHPERYPTERTAAQWKTIMLHMQVRANIPGGQARLILQYLQDNSGR